MRLGYGGQRNQATKSRIFPKSRDFQSRSLEVHGIRTSRLLVLAEVAVIALVSCKNISCKNKQDYDGAMPAASERIDRIVDKFVTCRNFDNIKKELSEFANYLVREKNGIALNEVYETIYANTLALMKRSKDDSKPYVDDLTMLAQEFNQRKTHGEKMAIVFLALPRLFERELVIQISEPLGITIEQIRLTAEQDFLRMVEAYKPELAELIRKYWYKKDKFMPTQEERLKFFEGFAKLYQT
ncbi:hypothetical protein J4450_05415 [Candidatus Micrarchaeota archaeon]|nr:hypothetical protein [Candidatus Micrarchaeota archaeon]